MEILLALLLALVLIAVTVKKKAFTLPAALTAGGILLTAAVCGGYAGIFIVIGAYLIIFFVDLVLGKRSKKATLGINKKSGARDVVQVLVNSIVALVAIILAKITENDAFLVVYAVSLTECLADSLASDVGVLSKKDPIDVCRLRPIKRGLSGGVSLLGTLAALVGSAVMSLFSCLFIGFSLENILVILIFPMVGMLADSVLGSLVQAKYTCKICSALTEKPVHCQSPTTLTGGVALINNDAVNLISNFLASLLALLFLL